MFFFMLCRVHGVLYAKNCLTYAAVLGVYVSSLFERLKLIGSCVGVAEMDAEAMLLSWTAAPYWLQHSTGSEQIVSVRRETGVIVSLMRLCARLRMPRVYCLCASEWSDLVFVCMWDDGVLCSMRRQCRMRVSFLFSAAQRFVFSLLGVWMRRTGVEFVCEHIRRLCTCFTAKPIRIYYILGGLGEPCKWIVRFVRFACVHIFDHIRRRRNGYVWSLAPPLPLVVECGEPLCWYRVLLCLIVLGLHCPSLALWRCGLYCEFC